MNYELHLLAALGLNKNNHDQHIRAASCKSRLESQWETPASIPRGAQTIGGIKLKIGNINYLGCLTKRGRFHIINRFGVVWAMGWNIHYFGLFLQTFSPRAQVARRTKPPRLVFQNMCSHEVPFGGLADTLPFWVIWGQKPPILGAPDRKFHYTDNRE